MVTGVRGLAVGGLATVALAACGEEAAEIPFDSVSVDSTAPTTTADLGAALPPPSTISAPVAVATEAPSSAPAASTPTTVAPATAWVEATGNLEGLESECGNLSFVWGSPDTDIVIAGVALEGLWASIDGAEEWTRLGQGPGSAVITNRPSAIVDDREQPNTFYESGIYNGGGAYKTLDGGTTFQQLGDLTHSDLVSVDFSDPARATMLSGQHETSHLHRSTDGGATWTDVSAALPADIGYAAFPHVIDAQTHLLGTQRGTASAVLRTTDGGATWAVVHEGGVNGPVFRASDGNLYWLREGGGLIASADDGATWSITSEGGGISPGASTLLELPDGRLATHGEGSLLASSDQGVTWQPIGAPLPYTPNGIAYAAQRQAFYIWRWDCESEPNPVAADAIMRLDLEP